MRVQTGNSGKEASWPKDEGGFVLVAALMIMIILTLMGVASMGIRNTEQSVAKNSEVYQSNFYSVESATLEGVATIAALDDAILNDSTSFPAWLRPDVPSINLRQSAQWPSATIIPAGTSLNATNHGGATNITPPGYAPDGTSTGDRIWYAATDLGPCGGGSLTDPTKVEKCYNVYGMYDVKSGAGKSYHGKMMLSIGYKRVVYSN